jgi:hypothetical protein
MTRGIKLAVQRSIIGVSLIAGATSLAVAHHSYSAFDMVELRTVTGTIKKFDWTNPHTWIWIDVVNEQGVTETWGIEGMSPNYLARRGWSRTTLKPGDKISVTLHPLKTGEKGGTWVDAKRPNGETLMMGGAITDP